MDLDEYLWRNKMTKKAFAEKVGVHTMYLHRIISKKDKPSAKLAVRIEQETGKDVPRNCYRPDIFEE